MEASSVKVDFYAFKTGFQLNWSSIQSLTTTLLLINPLAFSTLSTKTALWLISMALSLLSEELKVSPYIWLQTQSKWTWSHLPDLLSKLSHCPMVKCIISNLGEVRLLSLMAQSYPKAVSLIYWSIWTRTLKCPSPSLTMRLLSSWPSLSTASSTSSTKTVL